MTVPLSIQPYKGSRDFYPEDKRIQKYMFGVMRTTVEKFGYEEYDAPILEPTELYASKTSDEIVREQTYSFTDRGGRDVTIRTEMTPSVSRMVAARRQELAYPLRWYSIPNCWRYERPQRGRLREFFQLNVDCFGIEGISADHENIMIADAILKAFGAKRDMYVIKLNSRQLINFALQEYLGLNEVQLPTLIRLIDRMHKMDKGLFIAEAEAILTPSQRDDGTAEKLTNFLNSKDVTDLPEALRSHPSVKKLLELIELLDAASVTNVKFDVSLMRGFDYYTDIVFEVFDVHPDNNRSMFGGGRYDGLISEFGVEPVPTVGFGMGDVTLQNFLEVHELLPNLKQDIDLGFVLIGDIYHESLPLIQKMRKMGLKVAVDSSGRKPEKQIRSAVKKGLHYILIVGETELKNDQYVLKNLLDGQEETHGAERIVSIVKDFRLS